MHPRLLRRRADQRERRPEPRCGDGSPLAALTVRTQGSLNDRPAPVHLPGVSGMGLGLAGLGDSSRKMFVFVRSGHLLNTTRVERERKTNKNKTGWM